MLGRSANRHGWHGVDLKGIVHSLGLRFRINLESTDSLGEVGEDFVEVFLGVHLKTEVRQDRRQEARVKLSTISVFFVTLACTCRDDVKTTQMSEHLLERVVGLVGEDLPDILVVRELVRFWVFSCLPVLEVEYCPIELCQRQHILVALPTVYGASGPGHIDRLGLRLNTILHLTYTSQQ